MDDVGQTLLNWASAFGTQEMVEFLCAKGADVNKGKNRYFPKGIFIFPKDNFFLFPDSFVRAKGAEIKKIWTDTFPKDNFSCHFPKEYFLNGIFPITILPWALF